MEQSRRECSVKFSDDSARDPGGRASQELTAAVILDLLITQHPAQLSFDELARLFSVDPDDPAERDDVSVALAELGRDGLIHRSNEFYFATRTAIRGKDLRLD
jgi:hypothetical protein